MPESQKHKLTQGNISILSENVQRQDPLSALGSELIKDINSTEALYKALGGHEPIRGKALFILRLRSWLTTVTSFDPVTGSALHTGIDGFMNTITQKAVGTILEGEIKDRVHRIVTHSKDAIQTIFEHPRNKINREHAMLPIYSSREIDSVSVQWLSRKPGRTLREKLSGHPYIKAVQRKTSFDTSENRLLKAFLLRFEQILIERQTALNAFPEETCEEFLVFLQRWLRSDDANNIGIWGNHPPNNTLLQDKRYRKVWDAWLWIQNIDQNIETDNRRMHQDILSVTYWKTLSLLNETGMFRTVQQPINIYYNNFSVTSLLPVYGYLFPEIADGRNIGTIEKIVSERGFGFIDDCFFHASDLFDDLNFDEIQIGQKLSFEIENTTKGKCAKRIQKTISTPIEICAKIENDQIEIRAGTLEIKVKVTSQFISVTEKPEGTEKRFELQFSSCNDVSEDISSLLTIDLFQPCLTKKTQIHLEPTDMSIVDLCSIRPKFTNNNGSRVRLPFRLLQQTWPMNNNGEIIVDCAESKAIAFRSDIETVSMRSLFSPNSTLSDAIKSNASMFFMNRLRDYIPANRLSYLVPDWGNDFDLECIRKSVNFYFGDSIPLPKSIAAIFAWQSSKRFEQDKIRENDFVLVIDAFDGGISITPVQAIYQKELNDILPESRGISWERHPTFTTKNKSIHKDIIRNLTQDGCQISHELIKLFGFEGLVNDAGTLSFVYNDDWYHLPNCVREILNQNLDDSAVSTQTLGDCLSSLNRDSQGSTVFILPLEDIIRKPVLRPPYNWLGSAWSPIKGCQTLNEWEKNTADIALWRDHLPELSIRIVREGHFENFYLVKDATVTPQRGRTITIPVNESFTLPSGKPHYRFPLQQGEGNQELQFVAYLKSSSFPLKKDTACKLQMTYTYGADDPYELKFIPLDAGQAEFKSIRVEWRSITDDVTNDFSNLPVPSFPERKTWSDFQKFPKDNDAGFSDLLEWMVRDMAKINDIFQYGRISAPIDRWIDKGDENIFCFVENTFIHSSMLKVRDIQELPSPGETVSFYKIEKNEDKFSGEDVCIDNREPKRCFLSKSLRFPVLTIWNNGHSLSEPDAPEYLRNSVFNGIKCALSLMQSENMPDSLKEEMFFFLSCLHKDTPKNVSKRLLEAVTEKKLLRRYDRNIAFALGDVELPWQKTLLANVVQPADNEGLTRSITMEILAVAFWRSRDLIFNLLEKEIVDLSHNLYGCLAFDLQKISKGGNGYQAPTLCKHLELLLALLRARENENESIKGILAPNKELTKRYVMLIDDVSKVVMENNIELRSRISLQIKKPEMFCNTPDLLYTLRLYLSGDSGANSIVITGIKDDD